MTQGDVNWIILKKGFDKLHYGQLRSQLKDTNVEATLCDSQLQSHSSLNKVLKQPNKVNNSTPMYQFKESYSKRCLLEVFNEKFKKELFYPPKTKRVRKNFKER